MAQQQSTPAAGFRVQQAWSTPIYFATWDRDGQEAPGIIEHLYELKSRESESIASGVAPGAKPLPSIFESKFDLFTSQLESTEL